MLAKEQLHIFLFPKTLRDAARGNFKAFQHSDYGTIITGWF
jgi:hypothetical protein